MDGQALLGSFRSHDENCSDRIQYDSESSGLARDQKIKRDAPSLAARILDSSQFLKNRNMNSNVDISIGPPKTTTSLAQTSLGLCLGD